MSTNFKRSHWAAAAVQTHSSTTGILTEDTETQVSDLLCNLMHYCRMNGIDYAECVARAARMNAEESGFSDNELS